MTITIKSIAEAAKVSRRTVDRVLHDRSGVSDEVRERIKKIAEEMGYKVNIVGRALAFQKNPIKIGVIILNKNDYFFRQVYEGVKQAYNEIKDFGIIIECRLMESLNVDEQLKYIKELEKEKICALALSPLEEDVIREELNRLSKKDIKIVTFNTDIKDIDRLCYVGQDLFKSGRVAGQLIGNLLPNGGEVAVITGPGKIKALKERQEGFEEIIEHEFPNIKIVDVFEISNDKDSSYLKTIEVFKEYPNLNGIFITGPGIGGVGKAISYLNKIDIKFVCFDLIPETVELINDRKIDFTITQEPFIQGYLPIIIIFDYFFRNKIPQDKCIYTKLEIKTRENI